MSNLNLCEPLNDKEMRVKESVHAILNTGLFALLKRSARKFGTNALLKTPYDKQPTRK